MDVNSKSRLRILHLEDDPHDGELIKVHLKDAGMVCCILRVDSRSDYLAALQKHDFDIILSDYRLPTLDGLKALELAKHTCPEIPFIFISGALGEESAVSTLKQGATDYVLKDRLSRLASAMTRALEDKAQRIKTGLLEEELRHVQKMDAIGLLAGGIAHDFNNLLTIVTSYSQLILNDADQGSPISKRALEIKNASQRAATLTAQLLAFSRRQITQPKVLVLNDILVNLHSLLASVTGENIEVVILPAMDLGSVNIDPDQFSQVIMNLTTNARDAMPNGGKLVIQSANIVLDVDHASRHLDAKEGEYIVITVKDTGTGMTDEIKNHLFEPYFTTKERGKGTGLGLSSTYGFIKSSGGHIEVISRLDEGTVFKIYFPRIPAVDVDSTDVLAEKLHENFLGAELVLVVEDEPALRALMVEMLTLKGYRVLEASNGVDALDLINSSHEKINLLLTDIIMPLMGGKELADKVKSLKPETKILFMSGYIGEAFQMKQPILNGEINFIQKPFTIESIHQKVRDALDAAKVV